MPSYIPDTYADLIILAIQDSDTVAVCSSQPTTFFHAWWPSLWIPSATRVAGDLVRPPTNNGFIYECITGGDSGTIEPPWGDEQDEEFTDGAAEWKTHVSYSLALAPLTPSELVLTPIEGGKALTVSGKPNVTAHASGTVGHTALLKSLDKTLRYVKTSFTSEVGTDDIVKGRVIQIDSFIINRWNLT